MFTVEVNYLAVLVATLFMMVIGGLWYSPVLFGNAWMKEVGLSKKDMEGPKAKKRMMMSWVFGFLSWLVEVYVLALAIEMAQVLNAQEGALVGFWVWLGFMATVGLGSVLWEMKSMKYFLINQGFNLVAMVVAGAILGAWI